MRLFTAIKPNNKILNKLTWLQQGFDDCHWSRRINIHLTLEFIGETDKHTAVKLQQQLASIEYNPIQIHLRRCGVFPDTRRARVIWAGIKTTAELLRLQSDITSAIKKAGIELPHRPYTPHITIGRIHRRFSRRNLEKWLITNRHFEAAPFIADTFHLIQSELTPSGPIYTTLQSIPSPSP
jgi:2'-5' RNA ligase